MNDLSFSRSLRPLLLLLPLVALLGCEMNGGAAGTDEALPHSHRFPLRIDNQVVEVQLAVTREEMRQGLMGRKELGTDEGMIFIYRRPMQASFWMKNTPLPLDVGYFSPEGILMEIYRLHPHDERPVQSRSNQVQFALEMNQGWFSRNRIRPGAFLDLDLLREALRDRGFQPEEYGL